MAKTSMNLKENMYSSLVKEGHSVSNSQKETRVSSKLFNVPNLSTKNDTGMYASIEDPYCAVRMNKNSIKDSQGGG